MTHMTPLYHLQIGRLRDHFEHRKLDHKRDNNLIIMKQEPVAGNGLIINLQN